MLFGARAVLLNSRFNPLAPFRDSVGFYLPDWDPARLTASGLSRLYTRIAFQAVVASVADPIGGVVEESLGAALGPELLANGGFDSDTVWNKGTGWTISTGKARYAAAATNSLSQTITSTPAGMWLGAATMSERGTAGNPSMRVSGTQFGSTVTADGPFGGVCISSGAQTSMSIQEQAGSAGTDYAVDDVSFKKIAGTGAFQLTTNSRGTLRQVGSRYVWRGDGVDDCLITNVLGVAGGMTGLVAVEFNAASDVAFGAADATPNRFGIGTDASGLMQIRIGTDLISVGADIRDIPGVAGLTAVGGIYYAIWKPLTGPLVEYAGTYAGSLPTTAVYLGASNNNGTAGSFLDGDISFAYLLRNVFTAGQMSAIANLASL